MAANVNNMSTKTHWRYLEQGVWLCALFDISYSGTSPKVSVDWAAAVYALMYSLAVFWTWHSWRTKTKMNQRSMQYDNIYCVYIAILWRKYFIWSSLSVLTIQTASLLNFEYYLLISHCIKNHHLPLTTVRTAGYLILAFDAMQMTPSTIYIKKTLSSNTNFYFNLIKFLWLNNHSFFAETFYHPLLSTIS